MRALTNMLVVSVCVCIFSSLKLFSQPACLDPGCVSSVTGESACPPPQTEDPTPFCCTTYWNGVPFSETALDIPGSWSYITCSGNSYPGGLYAGTNEMPETHFTTGNNIAKTLLPLNTQGEVDSTSGKIVLTTIGPSNMKLASDAFIQKVENSMENINPDIEIVNASIPGTNIKDLIQNKPINLGPSVASEPYWDYSMQQFFDSTSPEQVQIVLMKYVIRANPNAAMLSDFEEYVSVTRDAYVDAVYVLKERFPNLKMVFLVPLSYKGYMCGPNSLAEPYAYWSGFAIRDVIMQQIEQTISGTYPELSTENIPWISWGPYIWSNGTTPNGNGLSWSCPDDYADNIHPSETGNAKVGSLFLDFFLNDPVASTWFKVHEEELQDTTDTPQDTISLPDPDTTGTGNHIPTDIKVQPNPASTYIQVHSSQIESSSDLIVHLHDVQGRLVLDKKVTPDKPVSLENLPYGMYYYQVYEAKKGFSGTGTLLVK